MKSISKKVVLVLVILMLLFSINSKVYAWSDIISKGDAFLGGAEESKIDQSDMQELSGFLYNTLLSAGVVIAVIVATVLGVQFMMGGAEGQAKVKEMLIPFVVGCVIVFGGFGIWKIALSVGQQLESARSSSTSTSSSEIIKPSSSRTNNKGYTEEIQ